MNRALGWHDVALALRGFTGFEKILDTSIRLAVPSARFMDLPWWGSPLQPDLNDQSFIKS
jgi:hypothetical protein